MRATASRKPGVPLRRRVGQRILLEGGVVITLGRIVGRSAEIVVFEPSGKRVWREEIAPVELIEQAGMEP